ncbi:hypothetical protein TcasGA2_TC001390 [Tribolium castaneum]|uniref:Reverse transcriptase domain-containing protein n=1 Tax=Tribolium castaneum TaxID=7070 RepID=D7GYE3_TRICA|nr:hypothetical protein TcasGA2_TC001390 [Tribolium castaneum]
MQNWSKNLIAKNYFNSVEIKEVKIKRGIFQRDSLSPLLFCIALFPLTSELKESSTGYQLHPGGTKIDHLLYIDDLKLFAKSKNELEIQLESVKVFSENIKMSFGFEKCAKATLKKGRIEYTEKLELINDNNIKELLPTTSYKYLGIKESAKGVEQAEMKNQIRKKFLRRIRLIMKTELTADVHRLYVPRRDGGRGLPQIEGIVNNTLIGLATYLNETENQQLKLVLNDQGENRKLSKFHKKTPEIENSRTTTEIAKDVRKKEKEKAEAKLQEKWKEKEMHGQYCREMQKEHVNKFITNGWLRKGLLKGETEALITAYQDQAISTNYYKACILKTQENTACRICQQHAETIHHLLTGCPILAPREYTQRHDSVASQIHWNICKAFNIPVSLKWYEYKPRPVEETGDVTILWNMQIHTDQTILANKLDIVVKDKKHNLCQLIDVAIPSDYNVIQKEAEKMNKYKDLAIEVSRMWKIKIKTIPIIIGVTGLVSKNITNLL